MSGLTRSGQLGIYYSADDMEPMAQEAPDVDLSRVNVITGTKAPTPAPLNPQEQRSVQPMVMDYTGFALGGLAIVALYFLMK